MKLTNLQIDNLYKFTRQHYVYHYDVQSELVDHLANDIEEIWEENPKITFENARDKSFKKFGIFGFMDVVEAKQKQMNKHYWKILLRFAKEWFTLPKIITTPFIFLGFFFLLQIKYSEYILLGTLLIVIIFQMVAIYKVRKKREKKEKTNEKIFLFEEMISTTKNGFTVMALVNLFNIFNLTNFNFLEMETYLLVIISFILTLLCILFYVSNYVIPKKAEELLQETYPEYKLVKNL